MKTSLCKKSIVIMCCLCFFGTTLVALEETESITIEEIETEIHSIPQDKAKPGTFFFTLGLNILVNTDANLQSAPSPVLFSGGFGANVPITSFMRFSPHLSFFMNYYLWSGTAALPAEIENRTVFTPSLMIDLPFIFLIKTPSTVTSLGIGASVLARYGFLTSGVPASDIYQVDLINNYFWQAARWFYPMVQLGWDYVFPSGLAAGAGLRVYFPIASAFDKSQSFAQGLIISASVRLHLPRKKAALKENF